MNVYGLQLPSEAESAGRWLLKQKLVIWKSDGVLNALDCGGYQSRHPSILKLIEIADHLHPLADFPALLVNTADMPFNNRRDGIWPCLSFSAAAGFDDVPIPDFIVAEWPEVGLDDYALVSQEMAAAGETQADDPRCGWVGRCSVVESRSRLVQIAAEHPELLDCSDLDWEDIGPSGRPNRYRSLPEQAARWALLLDIEGHGYSGRLKLLMHSGRPVLIQDRPWHDWFWAELRPMQNFIPVRHDLSDLVEQVEWARAHPETAAEIGRAGQALAQAKLTRPAAVRAIAEAITRVSEVRSGPSYGPGPFHQALDPLLARLGALV